MSCGTMVTVSIPFIETSTWNECFKITGQLEAKSYSKLSPSLLCNQQQIYQSKYYPQQVFAAFNSAGGAFADLEGY